jgi:hypothetical protein
MNDRTQGHRSATLTGTGSYVPPRIVTNAELSASLGEDIAMSRYLDRADTKTVALFADGAGGAVVEAGTVPGVLASELFADSRYCHGMGVFAGGTRDPITPAVRHDGTRNHLRFVQKSPASVNQQGWPRIVRSVRGRIGETPADVDLWRWTQVNRSTIDTVMRARRADVTRAHGDAHVGLHRLRVPAHGARRRGARRPADGRQPAGVHRIGCGAGHGIARDALAVGARHIGTVGRRRMTASALHDLDAVAEPLVLVLQLRAQKHPGDVAYAVFARGARAATRQIPWAPCARMPARSPRG